MEEVKRTRRWLHAPSPAMIVACVALFVALGGTSYAAVKLPASSVGTKQIKNSAVTGAKVKDGSLTGADIKLSTLGKVPSAAAADTATAATTASTVSDGAVTTGKIGALPGAHVHAGTAQNVADSTGTNLSFSVADYNVGGVYDATHPDRLTAPVAGKYLIIGSAFWPANAVGERNLVISKNSYTMAACELPGATGMDGLAQQVSAVLQLDAGDVIRLWTYQNSGSTLNASQFSPGANLSMNWIAP
ncbi:MAG TPA: hypothetical protein VMH50_11205 [Thermoleophilia bacterium]|nr:hypothetical protein [Thermoleophilia bacterium]